MLPKQQSLGRWASLWGATCSTTAITHGGKVLASRFWVLHGLEQGDGGSVSFELTLLLPVNSFQWQVGLLCSMTPSPVPSPVPCMVGSLGPVRKDP